MSIFRQTARSEKCVGGSTILKIAGIQFAAVEDKEKNVKKAMKFADVAVESGAKLISFAELFTTHWFAHEENVDPSRAVPFAEPIPGPTTEEFSALAKKKGVVMVLPIAELEDDRVYNSAAVIDADGSLLGTYRKVHLPRLPLWYEKDYFTPGDRGFPVFTTHYLTLGVQICWDNYFPEGSRILGLKGAELIVCPTAAAMRTHERWQTAISANAIVNGLFALRINRTGSEKVQDFYGETFCVNPSGELLSEPAGMNDSVSLFDIDLEDVHKTRAMWPYFNDRRPDVYSECDS